ncbi:MAG: hypothetical protein GOVbin4580_41 [Prokaryotic dsDNA virus sp.]|nr:MAG: hypothetical protein GOVbin4580_41 [Prokaryotic dsDNA virus sp.]|tara:strand:+ start:18694 stop:18921 length:228 start_codon:yes stop_codon:yes gene_type:complete
MNEIKAGQDTLGNNKSSSQVQNLIMWTKVGKVYTISNISTTPKITSWRTENVSKPLSFSNQKHYVPSYEKFIKPE